MWTEPGVIKMSFHDIDGIGAISITSVFEKYRPS